MTFTATSQCISWSKDSILRLLDVASIGRVAIAIAIGSARSGRGRVRLVLAPEPTEPRLLGCWLLAELNVVGGWVARQSVVGGGGGGVLVAAPEPLAAT